MPVFTVFLLLSAVISPHRGERIAMLSRNHCPQKYKVSHFQITEAACSFGDGSRVVAMAAPAGVRDSIRQEIIEAGGAKDSRVGSFKKKESLADF